MNFNALYTIANTAHNRIFLPVPWLQEDRRTGFHLLSEEAQGIRVCRATLAGDFDAYVCAQAFHFAIPQHRTGVYGFAVGYPGALRVRNSHPGYRRRQRPLYTALNKPLP